eukprot:4104852-Lingulodinium_polyedra.AAC.1
MSAGQAVVAEEMFQTQFCQPAKVVEVWEKSVLRIYGGAASSFLVFVKVCKTFQTEAGCGRV